MEIRYFCQQELAGFIAQFGDYPPIGTQWEEMPADMIPASIIEQDGVFSLYLLYSEEDFNNRPWNARLVAFRKDSLEKIVPKRKPRVRAIKPTYRRSRPYRNLAGIF